MKTVLNVKTDKETKEKAQKIAKNLGLPLSIIVNASLKQFVRNKEIYFSLDKKIAPQFEKFLGGIEKDIRNKKNLSPAFSSVKEAVDYLHSK